MLFSAMLICIFLSQKSERDLYFIPGFALLDLLVGFNRTRRGSANKEQGEKSCIVSHNNFIFIDNFILFCKQ